MAPVAPVVESTFRVKSRLRPAPSAKTMPYEQQAAWEIRGNQRGEGSRHTPHTRPGIHQPRAQSAKPAIPAGYLEAGISNPKRAEQSIPAAPASQPVLLV